MLLACRFWRLSAAERCLRLALFAKGQARAYPAIRVASKRQAYDPRRPVRPPARSRERPPPLPEGVAAAPTSKEVRSRSFEAQRGDASRLHRSRRRLNCAGRSAHPQCVSQERAVLRFLAEALDERRHASFTRAIIVSVVCAACSAQQTTLVKSAIQIGKHG